MTEKDKNNFVVNDKTYVKKPEIHYSYKFQPYVKDLGGSPGKNITQKDRNKRLRHENNVNAIRSVVKGLNNTFGKAISGAAAFYGGGWALNRLLHLNKPSTLGQFFGRYVLPANTADNISDGIELIFDPSTEGAVDLGSGIVLGRFKDLSKPVRLVGELIGQGANINNMKNGGKMNTLEFLKKGSGIHIKKKNRGKFTDYCGGKVTDECIRKAKASGNPTLVKRATFAANARKWKHEDGGCFSLLGRIVKKHQTGGKTNFFNSLAGLAVISGVTSLISTATLNKKVQANAEALKALNEADWAEIEKEIIQLNLLKKNQRYQLWMSDYLSGRTMDQPSLIVAEHEGSEELNQELAEGKQGLKNRNKQIDAQADAETSGNWGNAITGILQNGLGMVGNYMANKGANNAAPSTSGGSVYKLDSFWTNPTLKTNYSFLNQ